MARVHATDILSPIDWDGNPGTAATSGALNVNFDGTSSGVPTLSTALLGFNDWSNIRLGNLLNVRVICNNPFETDIEKVAELVRTIQKTNLRKTSLSKLVIQS